VVCSSCAKRASEIRQRLQQQQGSLEEGSLARPKAPWFPPLYTFKDEQDPPNEFEDPDLHTLVARIIQFRHENSLPDIAYLQNVILHYTMMSNPDYEQHIEWYVPDATVHLSVKQYALSALAYVKATTHTPENIFVDQETAELRSTTCLNCPRNVPKVNGRTRDDQGFGQSRFAQLAKDRHTSFDNLLANRVVTQKKKTTVLGVINMIGINDNQLKSLAGYLASVIKSNNPFDKMLVAKFLTRPKLSIRQKHKKLQTETKNIMRVREKLIKMVSEECGFIYYRKPTHIEFKGYYDWRKDYNKDLESVLFSSKR